MKSRRAAIKQGEYRRGSRFKCGYGRREVIAGEQRYLWILNLQLNVLSEKKNTSAGGISRRLLLYARLAAG
jgi:hypothetical protein